VVLRRRDGRVDRHPETMKSSDPRRPGQIVVASSDPEPSRTLQDRLERRYSLDYEIEYGVTKQIPIAATIMSQQWSKFHDCDADEPPDAEWCVRYSCLSREWEDN
jgi:hypothetical protein